MPFRAFGSDFLVAIAQSYDISSGLQKTDNGGVKTRAGKRLVPTGSFLSSRASVTFAVVAVWRWSWNGWTSCPLGEA